MLVLRRPSKNDIVSNQNDFRRCKSNRPRVTGGGDSESSPEGEGDTPCYQGGYVRIS